MSTATQIEGYLTEMKRLRVPVSSQRPNETEAGYLLRLQHTMRDYGKPGYPAPDPLVTFIADSSPANAIRLAIADHKGQNGGKLIHWEYIDALQKALGQLERRPALIGCLSNVVKAANAGTIVAGTHKRTEGEMLIKDARQTLNAEEA